MTSTLLISALFLSATIIVVPIFKRLGLGSILGYLCAGIFTGGILRAIAPAVGVEEADHLIQELSHFSEFGVVLMLFLVGLEIHPQQLWQMRTKIFGLGGLQLALTAVCISFVCLALGIASIKAFAIGLILALSSTAIVMQSLAEKGLSIVPGGRASFSVLLFQDMAVIPIIALMPLLGTETSHISHGLDLISRLPPWLQTMITPLVIVTIFILARFAITPMFHFIARARLRELFTTAALGTVVVISGMMSLVGISAALGVFIAGVILSGSEYRHEIESDIEPFKSLLLGLFFMTVGASFDFGLFVEAPLTLFVLALGLMALKAAVLFLAGKLARLELDQNALFALALSQGGEFAFVLLAEASGKGILSAELIGYLKLIVAISMAMTPLAFLLFEHVVSPRLHREEDTPREYDTEFDKHPIILVGAGRFGQLVLRLMASCGKKATVIDHDPDRIKILKKWGWKVHYGDASRMDLLKAAGIDRAELLISAIDDPEKSVLIAKQIKKAFPNLKMMARARDRLVAYDLLDVGLSDCYREARGSAFDLAEAALRHLGMPEDIAHQARNTFDRKEEEHFQYLASIRDGDEDEYFNAAKVSLAELEDALKQEQAT